MWWIFLVVLAALLFIGWFIGSYALFRISAVRRKHRPFNLDNVPKGWESYVSDILRAKEWFKECGARELTLERNGYTLVADYLPSNEATGRLVVLIHGFTGSADEMKPEAEYYYKQGYAILLPDLCAHGRSGGKYIGMGNRRDVLDMIEWLRYATRELDADFIVVRGVSMGAATVLGMSAEPTLPTECRCFISDCAYSTAKAEFNNVGRRCPIVLRKPLFWGIQLCYRCFAGFNVFDIKPLESVKKALRPILFIHGGRDRFVPTAMGYELYEACTAPKELLIVPNAGHAQSAHADPEHYEQVVGAWLQKYMGRQRIKR